MTVTVFLKDEVIAAGPAGQVAARLRDLPPPKRSSDLLVAKSKLVRQEFRDKEQHTALVQEITKRKEAAGPVLEQVAAANKIIRQHPLMAFCGLDFILAQARTRVRDQQQAEEKFENDLDNRRFGYGL